MGEYRSPSNFMAYAEQAAEAFAKYALSSSDAKHNPAFGSTNSPSIVGGQDMSTLEKNSPDHGKATNTVVKDRKLISG